MSIDRRLLAIIGRRILAIYDVIPRLGAPARALRLRAPLAGLHLHERMRPK
jgi:hypothetical protein